MYHVLFWIAAVLFIIWLVFDLTGNVLGSFIHLLWIPIVGLLCIWMWEWITHGPMGVRD